MLLAHRKEVYTTKNIANNILHSVKLFLFILTFHNVFTSVNYNLQVYCCINYCIIIVYNGIVSVVFDLCKQIVYLVFFSVTITHIFNSLNFDPLCSCFFYIIIIYFDFVMVGTQLYIL